MEELTRTDRTQVAILTCSVATWRLLDERGATFAVAAGHSLGEYSALVAAGHMTFADALAVVDVRARAMHDCGLEREGAMAAVLGLDDEEVEDICAGIDEVWTANYNSPGQVVISGSPAAVRAAGDAAQARGAKRVLPVPVAGAFQPPSWRERRNAWPMHSPAWSSRRARGAVIVLLHHRSALPCTP